METIKKFVAIGPESTGKSTLCSQLAEHYHTVWVPEYAREYLEKNGMGYSYEDLLTIAERQVELEEEAIRYHVSGISEKEGIRHPAPGINTDSHGLPHTGHHSSLLFIDTDMYVMKVWCEYVFNNCHNWILNRAAERNYDGYLLCNIDLPWVSEKLREYPDVKTRNRLYHFYKDTLVNQSVPWVSITGSYEERFKKAVDFIEKQLNA